MSSENKTNTYRFTHISHYKSYRYLFRWLTLSSFKDLIQDWVLTGEPHLANSGQMLPSLKMEIIIPLLLPVPVMAGLLQNCSYVPLDWQDSHLLKVMHPCTRRFKGGLGIGASMLQIAGRIGSVCPVGRAQWGSSNLWDAEVCCYDDRDSQREGRE